MDVYNQLLPAPMHIPGYDGVAALGHTARFRLLRGRDVRDGRAVLLKVPVRLPPRAADVEALEREAAVLRSLDGDGLLPLVGSGCLTAPPCLVFEDEGFDLLATHVTPRKPLPWILRIADGLCRALHGLHDRGCLAGPVSPSTVLVSGDGSHVRFADLTLSVRAADDGAFPTLPAPPSPYTSPERTGRVDRSIDERSDLYSLGILLYELLVGHPPCTSSDPLELVHFHVAKTPPAPDAVAAGIPASLSQIVLRLLAKDPEERYQSALGLRRDLQECVALLDQKSPGSLTLGAHDVSSRFVIPHRLYGREEELETLRRAFDRSCAGRTGLVLVGGYSGVGKTALIHELYRPIVRERGSFASGKSDQVVRDVPYGALAQAFRAVVRQRLADPEERLARWRARLEEALGPNAGVLAEVVPEIALVVGRPSSPTPLDPQEAKNRFRYVLQRFAATLCGPDQPLVIFLDDLQWADAATLDLLQALLTAPDLGHFLVVGAYREHEAGTDELLTWAVERLEAAGGAVERLIVGPLAHTDLVLFVGDALRASPDVVTPLATLIREKTDGNPFFVIQFLRTLVQDGLVTFDRDRATWTFRLDDVRRAGLTDNVVDLMTRRIRRLSPRAQQALTLAASIGNEFTWDTLLTVSRQAPDEAAAGLFEALEAGLLRRREDSYREEGDRSTRVAYTFLHDRVQQAAYALIPDEGKAPVHLDIGRLLLARAGTEIPDDRLFETANHLNLGRQLITDLGERHLVARLNLAAARKAKASAAYASAANYLDHGLALLAGDDWEAEYELAQATHLEAAESLYLSGQFERAEQLFRTLVGHARPPLDLAQVHQLRILVAEHQSRWPDALASGREALALFGIVVPSEPAAIETALDREVSAIEAQLGDRSIASLENLPITDDAAIRTLVRTLTMLWPSAYVSGQQQLARLLSALIVRLTLEHGLTDDSAYGFVTHAITIGPVRAQYEDAYEWGRLALAVNARLGDPRRRAKIHQQFQAHVSLWRRPYAECLPHAREALRSGLETGDFVYAGYGAASEAWPAFAICRSLETFVRDYTPTLTLLDRLKMDDFRAAHRVLLNWALALQGRTVAPDRLSDEHFDEQAYEARYAERSPFFLVFLYAARLHLSIVFERWPEAVSSWRRARAVAAAGTIWPALVDGWGAIALGELHRGAASQTVEAELHEIEASLGRLAAHCAENFRGPWLLASMAAARLRGDDGDAVRLAADATAVARDTGNVQLEALAAEAVSRACEALGRDTDADAARRDALRSYAAWGASAKVRLLDSRARGAATLSEQREEPAVTTTDAPDWAALDMATVLKLARAVAVALKVDDLLRTLIAIAMENAGAQRGVFLVSRSEGLFVEAEGTADHDTVVVGLSEPLAASLRVPHAVVQYVSRTGQDVVVGHAASDERFATDPYIDAAGARSMLCVPVSHQGRLGGVLYLENDLTSGAFTPERAEMMRIVAAQAAISLENARLYEAMAAEVHRRTAAEGALREAVSELESLKNRLEAENVYLQEEIQTQHNFTDVVGNSPALREALRKVERVAQTASTVLITGETGTGKEIVARALHGRSTRRDRPLVKVNCGAIPAGLVESELFGHVKGAFTGALQTRRGRFELADGGTLFLDEVGELPLDTQVKLLRVLQEQEFEPVGATRPVRVDVRIIAATNRSLEAMVKAGTFRADLFYRLNVFPIGVPALRERREDIPLLVTFFLGSLSKRLGKPLDGFTAASLNRLRAYDWPGNVRELQNVVERAAILATGPVIDLPADLVPLQATSGAGMPASGTAQTLEDLEREHILRVVRQTRWTIEGQKGAASILGLHPNTLRSRMKKLGIVRERHEMS